MPEEDRCGFDERGPEGRDRVERVQVDLDGSSSIEPSDEGDIGGGKVAGEDELLGGVASAAPGGASEAGQLFAEHAQTAAVGLQVAAAEMDADALARTARPEQAEDRPLRDGEREVAQHGRAAKLLLVPRPQCWRSWPLWLVPCPMAHQGWSTTG